MANTLLRSGDIKDFQALGQDGKAVYLFATQIRDTFKARLGQQYANHLAIPQRNDHGNIIDWYIPFVSTNPNGQYDIIPWTSANEQEKNAALIKLQQFEQKVIELGRNMASNVNLSGDQLLFSRLVYNLQVNTSHDESEKVIAIRFPSADFVYIVNGIPVITFWGFLSQQQPITGSAFRCLYPINVVATPLSVPIPPVESVKHKRWWWLLPLLLLLLLLFFLLRGCSDKVGNVTLPTITVPNITAPLPEGSNSATHDRPTVNGNIVPSNNGTVNVDLAVPDLTVPVITGEGGLANGGNALDALVADSSTSDVPSTDIPATDARASDLTNQNISSLDNNNNNNNDLTTDSSANTDPNLANDNGWFVTNPVTDDSSSNNSTTSNQLILPSDVLKQGTTDFLNGTWNAGSGIQDEMTGKPLRLEYHFEKGNGTVTVTKSDGVKCVGNVTSDAIQGNLDISNQTQAICSDNSHYLLPKIKCVPGQKEIANCQGDYGDGTKFPIIIKQQLDN